ncbi:TRAP transporter large permease [Piscinibacter sakaiensis]|uniref:TRAP-type C4-dicarboxylate transport system, large permease component n=1 Tax=Piscinibacter sakaiensis TaxID=1547922 RepID=A0A0K8P2I3_PISS1|nr:TRAP transporter large permease subunit [Piscinibacter sakaiensis]GAP36744.1 TRAP-type C4-dicarboxylate transport system, large permease component [Piscinibacter sakaiensis]
MRKELRFGLALIAGVLALVAVLTPWGALQNGHIGLLMLATIVVTILLGFPTAFTLMGMGVIFALIAYARVDPSRAWQQTLDLMVQRAYAVMTNDVLIAIPLFVFMGYVVERANLIEQLFKSLHLALARVPGALAVATLVTCAVFATATGIVGAVITLMGLLAMPAMLRAGYDIRVIAGAITAGGCLGVLIPPSVLLILYGATAGVSVVRLYAGALLPGLMLAGLYIAYVVILARWKPALMPPLPAAEREVALSPVPAALGASPRRGSVLLPLLRALVQPLPGLGRARAAGYAALVFSPALLLAGLLGLSLLGGDAGPAAPAASLVAAAQAESPAAAAAEDLFSLNASALARDGGEPPPVERATLPAWLPWAGLALALLALGVFYAGLSAARLEVMRRLATSFLPLALLIAAVLGSIVAGIATPTEAAAVGAVGGMLLAVMYRRFSLAVLRESVYLTTKTSSMVCWLFIGSAIFSAAFALLGGQELIERWVMSLGLTPLQFLLLSQLLIFLLGWPLEWTEIIVIFMPIFVPLLDNFGVDPLFFGLLVALNLQTAYLSPPVAMSAFYLKGVSPPEVTLNQIFAGMLPFMGLQVLAMVVLYLVPGLGLWLPSLLYG